MIKGAREAKGLSQPQLAKRVGTKQQTIDKIETGKIKHSSFLPAIAVELGIPVARVLRPRGGERDDRLERAAAEIEILRGALHDLVDAVQRVRPIPGRDSRAVISALDRAELALAREH
jgi:transcriptional regulator with XRE-family HTH domain